MTLLRTSAVIPLTLLLAVGGVMLFVSMIVVGTAWVAIEWVREG